MLKYGALWAYILLFVVFVVGLILIYKGFLSLVP